MDIEETPVLDNHMHLDPVQGRNVEAVEEFAEQGGTHLLVLNKPSWHLVEAATDESTFREAFDLTVGAVESATEVLPGRAWPVLGVHPALVSKLVEDGYTPAAARDIMQTGLDVAAEYVRDGPALAIKSGRPHYDVDEDVWDASNAVMCHAFELAADGDFAVQLHTEGGEDFEQVAQWAEERGMDRRQVVKHYSGGRLQGPTKSVLADKDELEIAIEEGDPFLMETDYIDDPDRPGAVLGPKTVPRRVRWLLEAGHEEAVRTAHVETPRAVYGIDTEATLTE
ncbi:MULTISPECIES: TatD family hydrolase [Haloarcula]|uniref:Deoxyribonuclease n=1 Tax=Haloarcula pellucida TaxID=1427151 RepID=A0A830GN43_9EURY|nr:MULTISPECIES: TatD family hydrolase [Halomicroarcula]MBX0348139.1 TatD family hydrolase [Halomicroarcula pellucida]MDS0277983.1 TatD family hydrolase [Halomicroarcula sp. S1AR25-4]GGN97142.1 deoxyribonuclease [Halomicroarcula pellucida]